MLFGKAAVPRGLFELNQYFRLYGPMTFTFKPGKGNNIIAVSNNYRFGSIVTSGSTPEELDKNIKDAILTSFEIPSSYAAEAALKKEGDMKKEYVIV